MSNSSIGKIIKISGPMIVAKNMIYAKLNDIVHIGEIGLIGEIIQIDGDEAFIQIFEDTTSLRLGEPVENTQSPLTVSLGPGLLGMIYDGIQRPLETLKQMSGDFIPRGIKAEALDFEKRWEFEPKVSVGKKVSGGEVLGEVIEKEGKPHKILVPPGVEGVIEKVFGGQRRVSDTVINLTDGRQLSMFHKWPVRMQRPYMKKLDMCEPFITGQRVIDTLFPISLGGTAILPGGFGSGKTVVEQMLAKFSNIEIVVYIGCGERGNEMTDILTEFPELKDPKSGRPLMERTILIANTSNMPVAAREASIYTGLTIAEYYRDMGYNVALLADSTSRWAEAMRENSSRLEEMPGEEGYPTYLATRLAQFYERSGKVICLGDENRVGSVTIVGAVSPPGGDYSEPVTQNSMRVVGALWALDSTLAYRRHFPAINWNRSYTLYNSQLEDWYIKNISSEWIPLIKSIQEILQKDSELQEIVQLVGPDGLQDVQRVILETGKAIRQDFLQQNAFSSIDAFCSLTKQKTIMEAIIYFNKMALDSVEKGVRIEDIIALPQREDLSRLKEVPEEEIIDKYEKFRIDLQNALTDLIQ